jgi:GH25 family lysozyme M1 (1,4-beta-N-acetylmuramidase)
MAATRLKGVDVSNNNGSVDWRKVAGAGIDFAIVKISEGGDFIDFAHGTKNDSDAVRIQRLQARCAEVRRHGMTLGVYHFLRPRPDRTGDVEAEFAVKVARKVGWGKPGDLRLCLDVEVRHPQMGAAATHRYIGQFVKRAKQLTGHRPLIYTFPAFWDELGNPSRFRCPLWIAHFGVDQPRIPRPWSRFVIWQHTSEGGVAGIAGNVDLNKAKKLPVIAPAGPATTPAPALTKKERLIARMRRARRVFEATGSNQALRTMLICKARLGRWDPRYLMIFGPPGNVTRDVKRFITRGYAMGLVPTSTTNGLHSEESFHFQGRAADMGLRTDLIGTQKGLRRMERFQRAEFKRRHKTRAVELIGPVNNLVVLGGVVKPLPEGSQLENQHDNHVHGAF